MEKLLPLLTVDPAASWSENPSPPCGASASLISNVAQFSTLTSANLQGWFCSVHMTFPTYPTDWAPLALATDTPSKPTCGNDVDTGLPACGESYILISGVGITTTAPNLELDPLTGENPVGTPHTVTATVTNADDTPRSGVTVSWVVTGANAGASGVCVPATCITGADGKVSFTYTGTNIGDDTINAAISVDGSRQTATAAKTWVEAPKGSVKGKGSIQTGRAFGRATFEVDAGPAGGIFYGITGNGNTFEATSIEGFTAVGNTASFSGNAKVERRFGLHVQGQLRGQRHAWSRRHVQHRDQLGGTTVFSSGGPQKLKTGNVVVDDGVA